MSESLSNSIQERYRQWSSSRNASLVISLGGDRWVNLEPVAGEGVVVALMSRCRWTLLEAAERGLRLVNLRERRGAPLMLGMHRDALVVSRLFKRHAPDQAAFESVVMELIRFSEQCIEN